MSLSIKKEKYPYFEITGCDTAECSVDTEYYLPDYCPDIQKILKCIPDVQIVSDSLTSDKLSVQGNLNISVMYTDEKGDSIRNCELSKEFTVNIKLNVDCENAIAYIKGLCGHVICRAVSARKLDIHIPVIINYTLLRVKEQEITADITDAEKKTLNFTASKAFRVIKNEASLSQNMELSGSMKPVESILRKDIEFLNVKAEPDFDAVDVSATAEITVIYRSYSENSMIEKLKYRIPFNERIELTGIEKQTKIKCDIMKGELSLQSKEDNMGENTVISLYAKFSIALMLFEDGEVTVVEDAYPLNFSSQEKYIKLPLKTYREKETSVNLSGEIVTDNLEKIIDIWCDECDVLAFSESDKVNFRGKFNLSLLYYNQEKKVQYINKTFDYLSFINIENEKQLKALPKVKVKVNDFKILNSSSVKADFEVVINSFLEYSDSANMLVAVDVGDEIGYDSGKINLIYSSGGEKLWDIAKRHRVSLSEIFESNNIFSEEELTFPIILCKK